MSTKEDIDFAVRLQNDMEIFVYRAQILKEQLKEFCKEKGISKSLVKSELSKLRKEWKKS